MERDYNNFDYLSVSVKSAELDKVLNCYRTLGWNEIARGEDDKYEDMKYISFSRPHKIANKDRLQYLQVRMESAINGIASSFFHRHKRSIALTTVFVTCGLIFIALGLWLMLGVGGDAGAICGIILTAFGGTLVLAIIYPLTFVHFKENKEVKQRIEELLILLDELLEEAETLVPKPAAAEEAFEGDADGEEIYLTLESGDGE